MLCIDLSVDNGLKLYVVRTTPALVDAPRTQNLETATFYFISATKQYLSVLLGYLLEYFTQVL